MKQYVCTIEIKNEDMHFFHTNVMYSPANALAVTEQYLEYAKSKHPDLTVNFENFDSKEALEKIENEDLFVICNDDVEVRIIVKVVAAELSNSELASLASAYDNHKLQLTKKHIAAIPDITLESRIHDTYLSIEAEESNPYVNEFISLLNKENFLHKEIKYKGFHDDSFTDEKRTLIYILVNDAETYNRVLSLMEPFGGSKKEWLSNARKEYRLYCSIIPVNNPDENDTSGTPYKTTVEEALEEIRSFDTLDNARYVMCEYAKRRIVKSVVLKECVIVNRETGVEDVLNAKEIFVFNSNL